MKNQSTSDKKDKTGGDVTKAVPMNVTRDETVFDLLNNTGKDSVGNG